MRRRKRPLNNDEREGLWLFWTVIVPTLVGFVAVVAYALIDSL